jgi:hypothetical protein
MRQSLKDTPAVGVPVSIQSVLAYREAVIAYALAHPERSTLAIARALRERPVDPIELGHSAVSNILNSAGLNSRAARERAATSAGIDRVERLE